MDIKELIETLKEYEGTNVLVGVDQPNPFQIVITINI